MFSFSKGVNEIDELSQDIHYICLLKVASWLVDTQSTRERSKYNRRFECIIMKGRIRRFLRLL